VGNLGGVWSVLRVADDAGTRDHAGVSPKVASTLMGHKIPEYHAPALHAHAARELERARDLLDKFLVARTRPARTANG
jgi:hypothetical protein